MLCRGKRAPPLSAQLKMRNTCGGLRELTLLLYVASRGEMIDKAEVRAMALAPVLDEKPDYHVSYGLEASQ